MTLVIETDPRTVEVHTDEGVWYLSVDVIATSPGGRSALAIDLMEKLNVKEREQVLSLLRGQVEQELTT